jgi:hypothetical protein
MNGMGVDSAHVRRGAIFLANIGVPVIVGVLRHQPGGLLIGAVAGMLLGFADNDGQLLGRLRLLALNAGAMAGGGVVGYLCQDSTPALWLVFVALTLSVGVAAHGGREMLLTARNGAAAFTVAAELPSLAAPQLWYLIGAIVVSAASRAIDHELAGPLALQPGALPQKPYGRDEWLRFALAFSGAAVVSMWIGRMLEPINVSWIVVTSIVVMLPDAKATFYRIVERVLGTVAGVIAAWIITTLVDSVAVMSIAILVVAPLIPHHVAGRYWLHTGLIALMVLLCYDLTLLNETDINSLLMQRLLDILLGCAIVLAATAVAFPREAIAAFGDLFGGSRKGR